MAEIVVAGSCLVSLLCTRWLDDKNCYLSTTPGGLLPRRNGLPLWKPKVSSDARTSWH